MPTIEDLVPAAAAADDDLLPVDQAGVTRRVTRAQLVAGLQPALTVAQGMLLGRTGAGLGGPEAIGVGSNLALRDGVLSAAPGFRVGALPSAAAVSFADSVAVSQFGVDVRVPVGTLLSGVGALAGLDVSNLCATAAGGVARPLADWAGDAAAVEAFGAVGDGVTDDTAAIDRAVKSGRPVRFGPRTYVLNGQWTVTGSTVLLGAPGQTVLRRLRQAGGTWVSVEGARFEAHGLTFDAGRLAGESWGVLVAASCGESLFEGCTFQGATGNSMGCGLTIGARDGMSGTGSAHRVVRCVAAGNDAHGIWVQAAAGAVLEGCRAHDNGQFGLCLDFNDSAFVQKVRHGRVSGCEAWANRRGISVGNYNETNTEPPRWGNGNPDVIGVVVEGNRCHDNADYGIAVSGLGIEIVGNLVEANGSGLLVNAAEPVVAGNVILGPGQFGIDAGGSIDGVIQDNLVRGFAVGVNSGGSQNMVVAGNTIMGNEWGVTVYGMETDASGVPFGISCTGLAITDNRITLKDASGGGIALRDAPQGVAIARNSFFGSGACVPSQALWAHTDHVLVQGNLWNGQAKMICNPVAAGGMQQVQVPDVLDTVMLTAADGPVGSLVGQHQAAVSGQVTFIRVTAGGSGYSSAQVTIAGSGTGASATALIRDGAVIGVSVVNPGAGYGASGLAVSVSGDGIGAQAVGTVGLPVFEGRRLRVHCNGPVQFLRAGSAPFQDNWTGFDILVPRCSVIDWVGAWGNWQAVSFPLAEYLAPRVTEAWWCEVRWGTWWSGRAGAGTCVSARTRRRLASPPAWGVEALRAWWLPRWAATTGTSMVEAGRRSG